jgi:hypothetical protein
MPSVSKAQNAAMHAAEEGRSTLGIPAKVGAEFVAADHGRKVGKLPDHVTPKRKAVAQAMIGGNT